MSTQRKPLLSILACVAAVSVLTAAATRPPREPENPREIARLRAHFDSVLGELGAADVSSLTPSQRSARTELVARLEQYAAAGRFPHNHVRRGELVPVFRDEHQTLCAMAFLIASTKRGDIVDDIAATHNLAYIPELAHNAKLRAWLDSTGLTVAEAARIQPQYDGGGCLCQQPVEPAQSAERQSRRDYGIASALVTPLTGASLYLSLASRDASVARVRTITWLGVIAGSAQLVYGATGVAKADTRRNIGAANIAVGGSTLATSIWRMRHPARRSSRIASVSIQPLITPNRGAGLLLSARM